MVQLFISKLINAVHTSDWIDASPSSLKDYIFSIDFAFQVCVFWSFSVRASIFLIMFLFFSFLPNLIQYLRHTNRFMQLKTQPIFLVKPLFSLSPCNFYPIGLVSHDSLKAVLNYNLVCSCRNEHWSFFLTFAFSIFMSKCKPSLIWSINRFSLFVSFLLYFCCSCSCLVLSCLVFW